MRYFFFLTGNITAVIHQPSSVWRFGTCLGISGWCRV